MSARIPAPADLAEMVAKLSVKKALMRHYNVTQKVIYRWASEAGLTLNDGRSAPRDCRQAPDDFAARAPTMSKEALRAHYRVGPRVLERWFAEKGVQPSSATKPRRVLPQGFAKIAPTMVFQDLMAHYSVSKVVISRWLEETGTRPLQLVRTALPKRRPVRGHMNLTPTGGRGVNFAHVRQSSIHEDAADDLRRDRWAVHRCDERGRYEQAGNFWRVGNVVCTPDDLLERAERVRRKAA